MEKEIYKGGSSYDWDSKEFIDDTGMIQIESMLKEMELCMGYHLGHSFYHRASDDTWWDYSQCENYDTTLAKTSRAYIESHCPEVDCEDRVKVHWLD